MRYNFTVPPSPPIKELPRCLDFFAGSGLVTEALKGIFNVIWACDFDPKKEAVYCANHGNGHFSREDISSVRGRTLEDADLSWASFPCQDLSLAGKQEGIQAARSGLIWEWVRILDEQIVKPKVICLENVMGLLTAGGGLQYQFLHRELRGRGYTLGAIALDGARWVPQSRPRVFVIGIRSHPSRIPAQLKDSGPNWLHPKAVQRVAELSESWVWWKLPEPDETPSNLSEIVEWTAECHSEEISKRNLEQISPLHSQKLLVELSNGFKVASGYRRTRNGKPVIELRFDGKAGCLRTPHGGSSRQLLVLRNTEGKLRTRLLTVREAARLMGADDSYVLPGSYNDGYKAMGDAVVVPAVRFLAEHLLEPLTRIGRRA
jgi:DNA (cytosine-5)-methyltransferase 1